MTDLDELVRLARLRPMTPEEMEAQKRSFVISEAKWGSDEDEADYRAALIAGDTVALDRLCEEAEERGRVAARIYDGELNQ